MLGGGLFHSSKNNYSRRTVVRGRPKYNFISSEEREGLFIYFINILITNQSAIIQHYKCCGDRSTLILPSTY